MANQRKIAMVVQQVAMDNEDTLDVAHWLSKTPAERLEEVSRLRNNYYKDINGNFPVKMEKVFRQKKI
ncbi:hypothetical protein [Mucilaginibacter terrae]|uniref:Addiction module protein n=1 Tax=Mucilaginibacter terrae TaxID=1955052 RepID=A0ABU3GVB4_9SPHI|nr:hypothetical protein [Mucilaginibacter terrae]MDT3403722.1 hypothetical protein [Mucilaginibacter terrae]